MEDSLPDAKIFELEHLRTTTTLANLGFLGSIIQNIYKIVLFTERLSDHAG